jgi:Winged helix DNA-binding domain
VSDAPLTIDAPGRNRALLARQGLLERLDLAIVPAMERFGGLQAQEPASPFIGLWTRLRDVTPDALADAFLARDVVKATLMRMTLHAVSAADYRRLRPALAPLLNVTRRLDRSDGPPPLDRLAALRDALGPFLAEPRLAAEIRDALAALAPGEDPEVAIWWFRRYADLIHAPASDLPWSFGRRPRFVASSAWLGVAPPGHDPGVADDATDALVRRHLGAFGPATPADIGAWSGLAIARLRPAIERLDAGGALIRLTDERGRSRYDLLDAPRPDGTTPAPPRLLPMWDSILLAHADRTHVIGDAERAVVIARNGDTLPTYLIDGRVAGLWWIVTDASGQGPRIELDPFRPLAAADRRALVREAEVLAAVVEPLEPQVYARYRRHRGAASAFGEAQR